MALDIFPGDLVEVSCPESSQISLQVGQVLQSKNKPAYVVVEIQNNTAQLGPLMIEIPEEISIPCSDGSTKKISSKIQGMDAQKDLPMENPVGAFGLAFPWMTLLFWLAIIAALIISGVLSFRYFKNKKDKKKIKKIEEPILDAGEKFQKWLSEAGNHPVLVSENANMPEIKMYFQSGQSLVRGYLEYCLDFFSPAATSSEFIGEYKIALAKKGFKGEHLESASLLESSFYQADQVRFAEENAPLSHRKAFFDTLLKLRKLFDSAYKIKKNPMPVVEPTKARKKK